MEIDVTHMVEQADEMIELSGSAMEHGTDAARITWNNSVAYGKEHPLLTTDDMREAARAHFKEYGAWTEDTIAAWSEDDLQGIMVQDVAAAIREMEDYTHEEYVQACEKGSCSGRIFLADDGRWLFYLGV